MGANYALNNQRNILILLITSPPCLTAVLFDWAPRMLKCLSYKYVKLDEKEVRNLLNPMPLALVYMYTKIYTQVYFGQLYVTTPADTLYSVS